MAAAVGLLVVAWLGGSQVDHRIIQLDHKVLVLRQTDAGLERQLATLRRELRR